MLRTIPLHEELMLLALRDREGTALAGTSYPFGLAGGILTELVLQRRIRIESEGKRRVEVTDPTPTRDPLLDEWLQEIGEAKKVRKAEEWVRRIATSKELTHRVARSLVRRGILRADEKSVLWIFRQRIYPEVDPAPEQALITRVKDALFGDDEIDLRTATLVSLAAQSDILRHMFGRKEVKERKARMTAIGDGSAVAPSEIGTLQCLQLLLMVYPAPISAWTTIVAS